MKASIILVTRNRCADLRQTLESMRGVMLPEGLEAELLVVDNGSSDETAEVVRQADCGQLEVKYLLESRTGKSHGLNLGIERCTGDAVVFTDDDVRVPSNWVEGMCGPILRGDAKVVAGGMKLAPHLLRPWMTSTHRSWLAASEWLTPGRPESLVGGNMAVSREEVEKVPGFDPELGGGGLGFCEDGLFADQLLAAGYTFSDHTSVCIEHHLDPSRLLRKSWIEAARKRGESHAYRGHHWEHWNCRFGGVKVLRSKARLAMWRARNKDKITDEGCALEELNLVFDLGTVTGHLAQSGRPRNYERHGLRKIR